MIDSLRDGDSGRWRDLVEAHRLFRDGFDAYHIRNSGVAVAKLSAARDLFAQFGSPLALRAEFFLVCCDYLRSQYVRGLAGIERLAAKVKDLGYGALQGHVFQVRAVLEDSLGRTRDAIQDYGEMQGEFLRLGEGENVATAGCLLAQPLRFLGRRQEAWRFLYQSLKALSTLRNQAHAGGPGCFFGDRGFCSASLNRKEPRAFEESSMQDCCNAPRKLLVIRRRQRHADERLIVAGKDTAARKRGM